MPDLEEAVQIEGYPIVVGIDEAGRGPLAGPVVASAVHLKNKNFVSKIRDSKTLSAKQREAAFVEIFDNAYVGIGIVNESIIDRLNILQATFHAMQRAVEDLVAHLPVEVREQTSFSKSMCLLIDGNLFKTDLPYAYKTIVSGDKEVLSISCASIVAKVTRDRILNIYDRIFPQYGFKENKGYPTVRHKEAIKLHGLSEIHRQSFNGLGSSGPKPSLNR